MEDLFQVLLQGGQQPPGPGDDPLAQLLQGVMGGQMPQNDAALAEPDHTQDEMDLGSLLQGVLGGAGGLAGGAGQGAQEFAMQAGTGPVAGEMGFGGLLQSILGGTGQAPASDAGEFGDVLSAIMGGGSPTLESDAFLAPIASALADKLGLSPQVAQTVVAFVLGKLMANRLQPGIQTTPDPFTSQPARPQAASLEGIVQRMNSGKRVKKADIRSVGLAEELAAHTGLDQATAEASLKEVLNALGDQLGAG